MTHPDSPYQSHAFTVSRQVSIYDMDYEIVFVYGTLKKGFPNWHVMPPCCIFLGTAKTSQSYPLVVSDTLGIPYMLDLPDHPQSHQVYGELYAASTAGQALLDDFEGVSTGFYYRKFVDVLVTDTTDDRIPQPEPTCGNVLKVGSTVKAGLYFRGEKGPKVTEAHTVDHLKTLPMHPSYTPQLAQSYVLRIDRPQ